MLSRLRNAGSYILAATLAIGAGLWIASGTVFGVNEPETRKEPAHLDAMQQMPQVRVRTQDVRQRTQTLEVQARTAADRKITVRAEAHGRVVALPAEKGQRLDEGDLIARLDAQAKPARLAEARARLEQRRIELEAARRLSEKGFRARTQLAEAEAEYEAAQATVKQVEDELDDTELRAPFPGRVGDRMVELGDYMTEGGEVIRLIDLDPIKVVANVTERNVGKLDLGGKASAELVTGETIQGRLTFIASEADEATRTFRVEMSAANPEFNVRDGVTARLRIPVARQPAHLISPSILTLTDEGVVGVKLLDQDNRVRFQAVDILDDTPDGVWVTGLPDGVTLITVGQNFVDVGQEVAPVRESEVVETLRDAPLELPEDVPGKPGPEARP